MGLATKIGCIANFVFDIFVKRENEMKIRSLLLGSAAAMVAVSGAQAADAIVVEPEPVEYVRVCDAYGNGFFYIPGTETCIDFSGYIRSYYSVSHVENDAGAEVAFTDWASRARLAVTANSETDWGTLSGMFRIDTDLRGSGGQTAIIDRGLISLAGFRAGLGTQYWVGNHGFAGVNLAGIVSDPAFVTIEDGPYAGSTTASTMFDYTWAGDGFSITGGVQNLGGINRAVNTGGFHDYYAGFNYSASWGGVAFTAMHDANGIEQNALGAATGNIGGWAYKASIDLNLSEWIPGGVLHGMYMTDGDYVTQYVVHSGYANAADIWQISFQMNLTEELQLATQYSDIEGQVAGQDAWSAGVGLNWYPAAAPGFSVYVAYAFGEVNNWSAPALGAPANASQAAFNAVAQGSTQVEYDAFTIRVRRDF